MNKIAKSCALLVVFLAACNEDTASNSKPEAVALTEEAAGHYCQMYILEHEGPKSQVHLAGYPAPLWFSQVRDGIAYMKSPEQSAEVTAFYVNDMGTAQSWAEPGESNWIDANTAHFVVGSSAIGGMGAPEIVPFSNLDKATEFAAIRGGKVMGMQDISAETVLSPIEINSAALETDR